VILNKLSRTMQPNDISLYQLTEKNKIALKSHEMKARTLCVKI